VTQLRLQLRDAADREARRGPLGRLWQALRWDASRPAIAGMAVAAVVALLALVAIPYLRSDETLPATCLLSRSSGSVESKNGAL